MADTKISALTAGSPALLTDQLPVARSGTNRKLTVSDILAANVTDITWANLMTAMGGGTLTKGTIYHTTDAPDSSVVITNIWVEALTASILATHGFGIYTTGVITDRGCDVVFNFAASAGGRVVEVFDALLNRIRNTGASSTAYIDGNLLDGLGASSTRIEMDTVTINSPSGTFADGSILKAGSTCSLPAGVSFSGVIEEGGILNVVTGASGGFTGTIKSGSIVTMRNGSTVSGTVEAGSFLTVGTSGASIVNRIRVAPNMTVIVDNGTQLDDANIDFVAGGTITFDNIGVIDGFATGGNVKTISGGNNPTGDTFNITLNANLIIVNDGTSDISLNFPDGLHDGQMMQIAFVQGSGSVTWIGNFESAFFPGVTIAGQKVFATWNTVKNKWL